MKNEEQMTKHYTTLPEQLQLVVREITEQVKQLFEEDGIIDFDVKNEVSRVEDAVLQLLNKPASRWTNCNAQFPGYKGEFLTDFNNRVWKKVATFQSGDLTKEIYWHCPDCEYRLTNNVCSSIIEPISEGDKNILIQHMDVHICKSDHNNPEIANRSNGYPKDNEAWNKMVVEVLEKSKNNIERAEKFLERLRKKR